MGNKIYNLWRVLRTGIIYSPLFPVFKIFSFIWGNFWANLGFKAEDFRKVEGERVEELLNPKMS